jgi:TrmH family RNA methyltransferase
MQEIISTNNAKIKYLIQLQKKSNVRKQFKEFVIEGKREIEAALINNFKLKTIYFYPELFSEKQLFELLKNYKTNAEILKISKAVYKKIAYRNSTEGIIAIGHMKEHHLKDLKLKENPYLLIAESIEKPGNVGAILRSVDGAGAEALIMLNPVVDIYNPNVIRASLGMVFSIPIALTNINDLHNFLQKKNIRLFTASLQNTNIYFKENFRVPVALAVGAEDKGLSQEIRDLAYKSVYIPMKGLADSLNVSVSAAILLYETLRQRMTNDLIK